MLTKITDTYYVDFEKIVIIDYGDRKELDIIFETANGYEKYGLHNASTIKEFLRKLDEYLGVTHAN